MPKRKGRAVTIETKNKRKKIVNATARNNREYRNQERVNDNEARRIRRLDPVARAEEQERDTAAHRSRLQNPDVRAEHNTRSRQAVRSRRSDPVARAEEQERDTAARRSRLENLDVRAEHNTRSRRAVRSRRSDPVIRAEEQERDTAAHRSRLQNPDVRAEHNTRSRQAVRSRRSDPVARAEEQERDTAARRSRLENPDVRAEHNTRSRRAVRSRRSDPVIRAEEQERDTAAHRSRLQNLDVRAEHNTRSRQAVRSRRSDPVARAEEQERDTAARRSRLENPDVRAEHNTRTGQAVRSRRSDPVARTEEQERNTISRQKTRNDNIPWIDIKRGFFSAIQEGPIHKCYSCDRLFFKKSIKLVTKQKLKTSGCSDLFLTEVILSDHLDNSTYSLCSTCYTCIAGKNKKYPRYNINMSQLAFPELPEIIKNLSMLEERLIAARIAFMKIYALGCDRQYGIRSGVINVPVDVPRMFKTIPIEPAQSGVVHLKLKRKMSYQHHYVYERIRPSTVYEAGKLIVNTPLYIQENITLDESWQNNRNEIFNSDSIEEPLNTDTLNEEGENIDQAREMNDGNNLYEETLVDANTIVEFAPGEGESPLSILLDTYCEEFAFPSIWFGHPRKCAPNVRLSYEDMVYSEIRRSDRRAVRPDHLLFVHKKSQLKQLRSNATIHLKKGVVSRQITANQALDEKFINDFISSDDAYRYLANITGSPGYWEQQKKNVLAMIRQLGVFTLFITLSAAETHWKELLQILRKTVDRKDDIVDMNQMDFEEKARLIRSDPVTCALYFDHKFQEIRKTWIKTIEGPFKKYKVLDTYYRIEFQHRGSPHAHMVVWLEGAPQFDADNPESFKQVEDFCDEIISTNSDDRAVQDVIQYQHHKCSRTCKKHAKGKSSCRFGAPFPPMDRTRVLKPFPESHTMSEEVSNRCRVILKKLPEILDGDISELLTFDDFLSKMGCDIIEYLTAIKSQLTSNKVFLKRSPKDTRINNFCAKILSLMRSNMDIQFVLDPYACIGYIVDYINKSNRGISRLLRACVEDFKKGNYSIREKLKIFANTFYNSTEISAQEAAWCRLRLPMSFCSVAVEFINTGPPNRRHRILKSPKDLRQLPPDSVDIYKKGPIERYAERPAELENICLADFIALFTYKGKGSESDEQEEFDGHLVDEIHTEIEQENTKSKYVTDSGTLTRRKQRKVIRFVRYDINKDKQNFLRERIMLFLPWRTEILLFNNEEGNGNNGDDRETYESIFSRNKDLIERNSTNYITVDLDLNDMIRDMENQRASENNEETETNEQEEAEQPNEMNVYDYDDNIIQANALFDMGLNEESSISSEIKRLTVPDMLNEHEYLQLNDSLNIKQKDFLMHVLNVIKTNKMPFYYFVSGEAGVGKSRLIQAIYQSSIKYFRRDSGPCDIDSPEVLIIAYTGKAAHNVKGMTAHSAFNLTIAGETDTKLKSESLNTLRVKLSKLKFIIIDEISMLGAATFEKIDSRLRQVFQTNQPFGGRSIIVLGDFQQLRPVRDSYVFSTINKGINQLVGNILWKNFQLFELDEVMRQKDDLVFAKALSRLAKGTLTHEDIKMFESRVFIDKNYGTASKKDDKFLPEAGVNACRLMHMNVDVDSYNLRRANDLKGTNMRETFHAIDKIVGAMSSSDKRQALSKLSSLKIQQTQGLASELILQIGLRYMVTCNIDISDGLFNGAIGILRFIEFKNNKMHAVYLEFEDPQVGRKAREVRQSIIRGNSSIKDNWTPITRVILSFQVTRKKCSQVNREQYPLVISEGITVHKSQGSTLKNVTVFIDGMDRSLLYVAFSRVTKLEGLFIIGNFHAPKSPDERHLPTNEMKRLRQFAMLELKFQHLRMIPNDSIQIVSYNIQSLRKHHSFVNNDEVFLNSNILLLQESWITEHENIEIKNMVEVVRNVFKGRPSARGTIIYAKSTDQPTLNKSFSFEENNQRIDITACKIFDITFVNVYKNPRCSFEFFKSSISSMDSLFQSDNILICGDFNENFLNEKRIQNFFSLHYGLHLLSSYEPTTDSNTTIDGIFGKLIKFQCNIFNYESYSSFHKPQIIRLNKI